MPYTNGISNGPTITQVPLPALLYEQADCHFISQGIPALNAQSTGGIVSSS